MNFHVFQDDLGLYSTEAFKRIKRLGDIGAYKVFNITNSNECLKHEEIVYLRQDWAGVVEELNKIGINGRIYFHCYNPNSQYLMLRLKARREDISFNWVFWSGEFYNLPEFLDELYIGESRQYLKQEKWGLKWLKNLFNLGRKLSNQPYYLHNDFIKSFRNLDCFYGLLNSDYQKVVSYSGAALKHYPFAYQPFKKAISESSYHRSERTALRIMVNHSGDPTLNHHDALNNLTKFSTKVKCVLPLAYGNKNYIGDIKALALKLFGEEGVEIWEDYTSLEEYNRRLENIDIAVFNSKVQQGVGNVLQLLSSGVKIFFREENGFYQDLKSWGMFVYSIQSDLKVDADLQPLSQFQIDRNREILESYFSEEAIDSYFLPLLRSAD